MAQIGENALSQISEIIQFLKLEEIQRMIKAGGESNMLAGAKREIIVDQVDTSQSQDYEIANDNFRINDEIREQEIKIVELKVQDDHSNMMNTI